MSKNPTFILADKIPLEERLTIVELERDFKENKTENSLKELFMYAGKYLDDGEKLDFNCAGCRERIFLKWNRIVYHWTSANE